MPVMPRYVEGILFKLESAGYSAYAVGGCVRDFILGRRPNDWDIASSASSDEVERLFANTAPTGVKYGTVTVFYHGGRSEVTTFRSDGEYKNGRSPESVFFLSDICGDLERRDFTMNAMAMDRRGAIVDPFGGRCDTEKGIIRCVGEPERRFTEDALRMLRALRFSAVLGFSVEEKTLAAIYGNAYRAENLSAERVRDELTKLLASDRPEMVGSVIECGLLRKYTGGDGTDFSPLRKLPKRGPYRWCAFAYALEAGGKVQSGEELLRSLRLPGRTVQGYSSAKAALVCYKKGENRAFIAEHGTGDALLASAMLEAGGERGAYRKMRRAVSEGGFVFESGLALSGGDLKALGFSGPEIGRVKHTLAIKASLGEVENSYDDLVELAKKL